jgi:nucleotide-binding universal stress UspA family protein
MAHGPAGIIREAVDMEAAVNPEGRRILLAVDQAGSSRSAAREAIRLALEERAALIVISVVEPHNLHLPGGLRRRVDQERDRLASGALEIVRMARESGVQATFLIWEGDPAEAILEASLAEGADTIVLGARPRTNLRRLVLGSVSSHVASQATCDVVVVPA